MTKALGIFQSDIIIQSAIQAALADLHANDWLLDYCFASLPVDALTADKYGQKTVAQAKAWFRGNNIPVIVVPRIDQAALPCITISLAASSEAETTLGDIHYDPTEDADVGRPVMAGPFAVTSYTPATGAMTIPQAVADIVDIVEGMSIFDSDGVEHEILSVDSDTEFSIKPATQADFSRATLREAANSYVAHLESVSYKETYVIGCHVQNEPQNLMFLHSILTFALLAYKQTMLESRGFERSMFTSTDFKPSEGWKDAELGFSRYMNVTGYVRQYWPKTIAPKITSVSFQPRIIDAGKLAENDEEFETLAWLGDQDALTGDTSSTSSAVSALPTAKVYWGESVVPGAYTSGFVTGLPNQANVNQRTSSMEFNAGLGQYLYIAYPATYGGVSSDIIDVETEFEVGVTLVATVTISGVPYYIWRSNQSDLGVVRVKVK